MRVSWRNMVAVGGRMLGCSFWGRRKEKVETKMMNNGTDYCSTVTASSSAADIPTDGSPPGFPVPGILQARILEWVAIFFSSAGK